MYEDSILEEDIWDESGVDGLSSMFITLLALILFNWIKQACISQRFTRSATKHTTANMERAGYNYSFQVLNYA